MVKAVQQTVTARKGEGMTGMSPGTGIIQGKQMAGLPPRKTTGVTAVMTSQRLLTGGNGVISGVAGDIQGMTVTNRIFQGQIMPAQ